MKPQSKLLRFGLFASLYVTQGVILGYFASLNALYLLDNGLDMAAVGIFSSIALIPFVLKIFFGMLSDRFNFFGLGRRKPYIVLGLLVQAACCVAAALVNPGTQYWLFVFVAFMLQLGMAFYDTCTDGMALDITPPAEKGILQGFMVGGRSFGVIVAALIAGQIAEQSWPNVFFFLAAASLLPFFLIFFVREAPQTTGERFNWSAFSAFKSAQVLAAAGVGLVLFLVVVGANQIVNPALSERFGIDFSTAGLVTTIWGVGCMIGAFSGGALMDRFGDRTALIAAVCAVAVTLAMVAFVPTLALAYAAVGLFGIAYGSTQAIYFAMAMRYTKPAIAASMYAILMAVTNVGQGIGLAVGGMISKSAGYTAAFIAFAAIIFITLAFFPVLYRSKSAEPAVELHD